MKKKERLDALLQVLTEMTLCKRKPQVSRLSQRLDKAENVLLIAFVACMTTTVLVALFYRYVITGPGASVPPLVMTLYLLSLFIAFLCFMVICTHLGTLIFDLQRKSLAPVVERLKRDLREDAAFIDQLQKFDKQTLEYGLAQYRYHWEATNGRIAIFAGRIRQVGLFPALTAASMTAATLLKEDGNLILWAPLILACCFYILATIIVSSGERSEQVIRLMEYAIQGTDQQVHPSASPGILRNKTEQSESAEHRVSKQADPR